MSAAMASASFFEASSALEGEASAPELLHLGPDGRGGGFVRPIAEGDVRPGPGEQEGRRPADAARTAGDQDLSSTHVEHGASFIRSSVFGDGSPVRDHGYPSVKSFILSNSR